MTGERCPHTKELFGETLRCERERDFDEAPYHLAGHTYRLTLVQARRSLERFRAAQRDESRAKR